MSTLQDLQAAAAALDNLSEEDRISLLRSSLGDFLRAEEGADPIAARRVLPQELIQVGTVVYGFCNGVFGRDSYDDKIVIARGSHKGQPWAVLAETEDILQRNYLYFASGDFDFELMADNLQPQDEN